jgi:hydrogenase nickel incorporation protein HypB
MCVTCGCGTSEVSIEHEHAHELEHVTTDAAHARAHARGLAHDHDHDHLHARGPFGVSARSHAHEHLHAHPHEHEHEHDHGHDHMHEQPAAVQQTLQVPGRDTQTIALETAVLAKNQALAERNRGWLAGRGVFAINLMSSPGAGKTTLLERSIRDLQGSLVISVVEGDQATANDAQRIRDTGARAVQVNTGTGCHLEADMLARALDVLQPASGSLVVVENVGNLVCPALFDLGENKRVVIFSVTEGEDKPLKYPHMFAAADVLVLSKVDLLPYLRVDVDLMIDNALTVKPGLRIFMVSAYSGEGLDAWYAWLRGTLPATAH